MPKVKLEPVPQHIVVPDTNILWDKDKKHPVSPDFDKFWISNTPLIPMQLVIPEVVFGELHFQQSTSAIKCAANIVDQMIELSGITQKKYQSRLDHKNIRDQVGLKLRKWLGNHTGTIVQTPTATIDWSELVQDAIWRNPPFTNDPKDAKNEKGFRDALILETLCGICDKHKGTPKNIVFLCNDYLLRNSAEARQKHNKMLLTFESTSDFESYIKLTRQQLTDKFVKSIQTHARSKFFDKDDKTTIWYRDKIQQAIKEKFADEFPVKPESPGPLGLLSLAPSTNWQLTDERWWVTATRFDELVRPRDYHWISRVSVARLLLGLPIGGTVAHAFSPIREEVQVIGFDIKWKANVKADGRFHDISVDEIVMAETSREPSSEELVNRWQLRRAPPAQSQSMPKG